MNWFIKWLKMVVNMGISSTMVGWMAGENVIFFPGYVSLDSGGNCLWGHWVGRSAKTDQEGCFPRLYPTLLCLGGHQIVL